MGTRNPYTIIATIEYEEYATTRELLSKHDIESVIKPNQVDENDEPVGSLVDVYVPLLSVRKATYLLSGNTIDEYEEGPFVTNDMQNNVAKTILFLDSPIVMKTLSIIAGILILAACAWLALQQKHRVF